MATPGKISKKGRKKLLQAKTSLSIPYSLSWSPLPQNSMHYILNTLTDKLKAVGLEKREAKGPRRWKKGDEASQPRTEETGPPEKSSCGWTDKAARRQLAVGINEVTKALERNELRLVLVCKSAQPAHMTSYLVALSSTRQVPACQVPRLSDSVARPLGLKSILALGFRRGNELEDELFSDTVDAIIPRVPPHNVAWLPDTLPSDATEWPIEKGDTGKGVKRKVEDESREVGAGPEGQDRGEVKGLEHKPEDGTPEQIESAALVLQPLKVKKIVPNPSKIRKQKRKRLV
ncbi:ribonuclease P protein subunit p38 [Osmerus eperlanus]|uniref:ribonuclease P protein subunit p38 n=1 Tax=Osmerus eperlanus TaxID=29151 RepID=UPI002E13B588